MLQTLAPKEAKYDYVAIREVLGEIGDGVPIVTVDLRPGREPGSQGRAGPRRCPGPESRAAGHRPGRRVRAVPRKRGRQPLSAAARRCLPRAGSRLIADDRCGSLDWL